MPQKLVNLVGKRFGRLLVERRLFNRNGQSVWICLCDCGRETHVAAGNLKAGRTVSCGCFQKEVLRRKRGPDLDGRNFGRLKAIRLVNGSKAGRARWLCRCSCGKDTEVSALNLQSGNTKSCGCLQADNRRRRAANLAGERFGRLIAVKRVDGGNRGRAIWRCRCDCGVQTEIGTAQLRNGNTRSCGCYQRESASARLVKDMIGQRFGYLTVVSRHGSREKGQALWDCLCNCGTRTVVCGSSLRSGNSTSCGCRRSEVAAARRGVLNPNWDPNRTYEDRVRKRAFPEQTRFVTDVFKRDEFTCLICEQYGGRLRAHHIRAYHWYKPGRFNPDNGFTMCKDCHRLFHTEYGTHRNRPAQLRSFILNYAPDERQEACLSLLPY